jgi:peptidoglycan/LPS O-acetylase OafA/YrhL
MARSHKLPSFEGLRGIASFIVVLHHLRLTFYATSSSAIQAHLQSLPYLAGRPLRAFVEGLYNGTFAVWLFWIMSAFVLSLQFFLRAREVPLTSAHDYLEDAFLRRYPRLLLPVLASVGFAYALLSLGLMRNLSLAQIFGPPYQDWLGFWYRFSPSATGAFKSAVWDSFFAYDDTHTYNNVLWTMKPEYFGSLFLFAFLSLLGYRRSRFLLYPVIAFVNFRFHLHWLNSFVAGIALCDLFVNRDTVSSVRRMSAWPVVNAVRRSRLVAVFLWSLIVISAGLPNYGGLSHLMSGVVGVGLTLLSLPTQRVLSKSIPVFLGRISFGMYLIHVPVICSFSCWAYLAAFKLIGPGLAAILVSIVTCALSVALGYALYLAADRPALRVSRWLSQLVMHSSDRTTRRAGASA